MKNQPSKDLKPYKSRIPQAVFNAEMTRTLFDMINGSGKQGTTKDIDKSCDYPKRSQHNCYFYRDLYDYVGIATRVIEIYPQECWKDNPFVYETNKKTPTPFEKKVNSWIESPKLNPWSILKNADIASGIGRFSIIFFGFNDGKGFDTPVGEYDSNTDTLKPIEKDLELMYTRVFDESRVTILETEGDTSSPRYGLPTKYSVNFDSERFVAIDSKGTFTSTQDNVKKQEIHWTRVIHIAERTLDCDYLSTPILKNLIPYIWDIRKVGGGSAEMFWKSAFPGLAFTTQKEVWQSGNRPEMDEESLKEQVKNWQEGLERALSAVGVDITMLSPKIADPSKHMEQALVLLCGTVGCPVKVLLGTQAGHLASQEDSTYWNDKVKSRNEQYVSPKMIRTYFGRLIELGCCPKPKQMKIEWAKTNIPDATKADIALKKTQALSQFAGSNARFGFPLYDFLTEILGLPEELARKVTEEKIKDFVPKEITNPPVKSLSGLQMGKKSGKSGRKPSTSSNPK